MSSALEGIKARAEVNQYLGKTASQDEAKATLKLIAALEAALALPALVRQYNTSDDPEHVFYGAGWDQTARGYNRALQDVRDAINEALEGAE